ncbi:MAG: hypothetical protein FJ256_06795 [Phycisphaerae bacterium]|nr:hypothetical protein [Phycisphaerae bacterium]
MNALLPTIRRWWPVLVAVAFIAWPCLAQDGNPNPNAPRQPTGKNITSAWVGYVAMFFVTAVIVLVSLMGSKRSQEKE